MPRSSITDRGYTPRYLSPMGPRTPRGTTWSGHGRRSWSPCTRSTESFRASKTRGTRSRDPPAGCRGMRIRRNALAEHRTARAGGIPSRSRDSASRGRRPPSQRTEPGPGTKYVRSTNSIRHRTRSHAPCGRSSSPPPGTFSVRDRPPPSPLSSWKSRDLESRPRSAGPITPGPGEFRERL